MDVISDGVRYRGQDIPEGEEIKDVDHELAQRWINKGFARPKGKGKEAPKEENKDNEPEIELEATTEDGDPRCQEIKSDGEQCKNAAKYPEDNPIYCGTHKDKLEEESG